MHRSSAIQRLWYGLDHLNFYLRLDFQASVRPGIDCPPAVNVFWFYPNQTMHNSPIPLTDVPDESPLNYLFHNHLGINLLDQSTWFQEAGENYEWYDRTSCTQVGLKNCLEIAVPWADLPTKPDWSLRLVVVLSENGRFCSHVPEHALIPINAP